MDEMDRVDVLDRLAKNGAFAGGDQAALAAIAAGLPEAGIVRAAIQAALDQLERQGFIRFVPVDEWPGYVVDRPGLDPLIGRTKR